MTGPAPLLCWKCSAALAALPLPFNRQSQCPRCGRDLYVCRLCRHYKPHLSEHCDEPQAEHPHDPERANFCDWFTPRPLAPVTRQSTAQQQANARLDSLFGASATSDKSSASDAGRDALDDLFMPHKD
jgi:hypothetical protein